MNDPNIESDKRMSPSRFFAVQTSAIASKGQTSTTTITNIEAGWIESNPQFTVRKTVRDVDEQVSDDDSGCVLGGEAHTHRLHQGSMGVAPPPRQAEWNYATASDSCLPRICSKAPA